jgi:hypothetical protein
MVIILFSVRPNGNKAEDIRIKNKRTNSRNIGKDIGLDNLAEVGAKAAGEHITNKIFDKLCSHAPQLELLRGPGIQIGTGIVMTLLDHLKRDCPVNQDGEQLKCVSSAEVSSLGTSEFHKMVVNVGHPVTQGVKKHLSYRACNSEEKELASSEKDYIEKEKRSKLNIKAGFGQKVYNFFGKDLSLTVKDALSISASGLGRSHLESMVSNDHGIINSYSCICRDKRKVKLTNRMTGYDAKIKIHLVEINNPKSDTKTLIKDITHNNKNKNIENNFRKSSESLLVDAESLINEIKQIAESKSEGKESKGVKTMREKIGCFF